MTTSTTAGGGSIPHPEGLPEFVVDITGAPLDLHHVSQIARFAATADPDDWDGRDDAERPRNGR